MVNLTTSSDELWRVLPEEHDKAIYWLKKHFRGEERYEKMRDDLQKIIVRFPGCICHGIARKDDRHVFEVRTLLTDGQLSGKQSQDSQELRKFGDFMRVVRGLTVFNNCKTVKL